MSISKRLLWLNGIAIIAVCIHHAAAFSLQAMFEWTHRYMDVPINQMNFDQLGSFSYYVLMVFRLLLSFAGAAFFFISGYFVGITAKSSKHGMSWNVVLARVRQLIVPFLLWTAVRFVLLKTTPGGMHKILMEGGLDGATLMALLQRTPVAINEILDYYHWIPLLIQFYILSPFIVRAARSNWKLMMILLALLGWAQAGLGYLATFGVGSAAQIQGSLPNWFAPLNLAFWFPLGVVFGLHFMKFKPTLMRYQRPLLVSVVITSILVLVEYAVVQRLTGPEWLGPSFGGFSKLPFSLSVILCYLAYDKAQMPMGDEIANIGTKSLGIYLGNIPSVYVVAVLMYHLTPWLLGYQLVYMTILVAAGLGIPLLMMELVRRSPVRTRYRLLFG